MVVQQHNSSRNKKLAIEYYLEYENVTHSDVAKIFKITRQTFSLWLKEYENNNLERKKRCYESYKIKQKHVNYAIKLLNKHMELSIKLLWTKLKTKFDDFDVSERQLSRVIRDNNITRKRTTRRHYPETRYGKQIDLKKQLKNFYSVTDKFSIDKIISIDETSINAKMPSNYSRCNLGQRCVLKTTNNKVFIKYTLVCAMTTKGIVGYELYEEGGMTSERMIEFVNKFIKGKFKNNLIIMDNGGSHKSKVVQEYIKDSKNHLLYSVPYKPKTNSVESFFSQFKHYFVIDNKAISYIELKAFVIKILKKIPKTSYKNYMNYAYKQKEIISIVEKESSRRRKPKIYKK